MFDFGDGAALAALSGLLGGIVLGLAARLGRFCTLGAIEDALYSSDSRRLRMWGVAIGTAVLCAHVALAAGWIDPAQTFYLSRQWSLPATVLGGLIFGYGMALSGNCGYGALARLGGGDLRSLVIVIVMGLTAYVTISGPLAAARVALFPERPAEAPQALFELTGAPLLTGGLIGGGLVVLSVAGGGMMRAPRFIVWGGLVGLAVVSGWIGTQWAATTSFGAVAVESHSFARPLGESLLWLMTASAVAPGFAVGSVSGVLIGAVLGSWHKGHFRWEACEDPRELKRQILGAALMGPGAVLAAGCSVGQGLSAFSLLSFSAPLALLSIFAGAALGLRQLIVGFAPAE